MATMYWGNSGTKPPSPSCPSRVMADGAPRAERSLSREFCAPRRGRTIVPNCRDPDSAPTRGTSSPSVDAEMRKGRPSHTQHRDSVLWKWVFGHSQECEARTRWLVMFTQDQRHRDILGARVRTVAIGESHEADHDGRCCAAAGMLRRRDQR
jgi:hypothetical protein